MLNIILIASLPVLVVIFFWLAKSMADDFLKSL